MFKSEKYVRPILIYLLVLLTLLISCNQEVCLLSWEYPEIEPTPLFQEHVWNNRNR